MAWKIRVRGEQLYHHIYAWGNDRHAVFKETKHYRQYLSFLGKYSASFDIDIIAYALMEWHIHLFVFDKLNNISYFMMKLHGDYAQYFNKETKHVGHVFGERFNNKIVANNLYGKWLSRYIHRQALDAYLVSDPKDYHWTSYRIYLGLEKSNYVKPAVVLDQFGEDKNAHQIYEEFVLSSDDGPIDWGKRVLKVLSLEQIVALAVRELKIDRSVLLKPQGAAERHIRHTAIRLLSEKYSLSGSRIAEAFKLSRMAISKILKNTSYQH